MAARAEVTYARQVGQQAYNAERELLAEQQQKRFTAIANYIEHGKGC